MLRYVLLQPILVMRVACVCACVCVQIGIVRMVADVDVAVDVDVDVAVAVDAPSGKPFEELPSDTDVVTRSKNLGTGRKIHRTIPRACSSGDSFRIGGAEQISTGSVNGAGKRERVVLYLVSQIQKVRSTSCLFFVNLWCK